MVDGKMYVQFLTTVSDGLVGSLEDHRMEYLVSCITLVQVLLREQIIGVAIAMLTRSARTSDGTTVVTSCMVYQGSSFGPLHHSHSPLSFCGFYAR